jgi:hypothetical protein
MIPQGIVPTCAEGTIPVTLSIEDLWKLTKLIEKVGGVDNLQSYLALLAQCEEGKASSPGNQNGRPQATRRVS